MRYRKLAPTDAAGSFGRGDYQFGHGQADFWNDEPEAPAQAVVTRLRFQLGEWFLDTSDGTAWQTRILGMHTANSRDPEIRDRTLNTIGVTEIAAYFSDLNRETRAWFVEMTLNTVYGRTSPIVVPLVTPF